MVQLITEQPVVDGCEGW